MKLTMEPPGLMLCVLDRGELKASKMQRKIDRSSSSMDNALREEGRRD